MSHDLIVTNTPTPTPYEGQHKAHHPTQNLIFANYLDKQIRRIVVPRPATTLTLKLVKDEGKGRGHSIVHIERACHKDHACRNTNALINTSEDMSQVKVFVTDRQMNES